MTLKEYLETFIQHHINVLPLLPHLPETFSFAEPCAGDGRLISHLVKHGGDVRYAFDIEPQSEWVKKKVMH